MNGIEAVPLAEELEQKVREVPGVAAIYRPGTLAAVVAATRRVLSGSDDGPRIVVENEDGIVTVEMAIGVSGGSSAGATCRAVHDVIANSLLRRGYEGAITVTVAHVTEA